MLLTIRAALHRLSWNKTGEWSVILLLVFSILWRGGKSLDATWILMGVAWIAIFSEYRSRTSSNVRSIHPILWILTILFILWVILSYVLSTTGNYGLDEVLRTGALGLLFLWTVRKVQEPAGDLFLRTIVRWLALATGIAIVIGLFVYVFQPVSRFVGTFFDVRFHTDYWPNAWAEFLLLSWPVTWWTLRTENIISKRPILHVIALALVIGSLFLSFSRGAFVAFILQLALLFFLWWSAMPRGSSWKPVLRHALLIGAIALGIFFLASGARSVFHPVESVAEKVTFTAAEGGSSVTERALFWKHAFTLSLERPFIGWGPYSFRFVQPRLQESVFATSDHPHNVFLRLAMESGWPAMLLFTALILFILVCSAMALRRGAGAVSLQHMIFLGVSGVLLHNLIDYNLQFIGIALPFWIFLGALTGFLPEWKSKNLNKKFVRFVEVALATALLCVAVLEARHLVTSSIGRHLEARGDFIGALRWYEQAHSQWFSRDLHLSRAVLFMKLERTGAAKEALDAYVAQNSEDGRAWKLQGDLFSAEKKWQEALSSYERAYLLHRYNDLSTTRKIVDTIVALGNQKDLDRRRPSIEELMAAYEQAILRNAHFIALTPNVEELMSLLATFRQMYRADEPRYVVMSARVDHAASIERAKIKAREAGYLW